MAESPATQMQKTALQIAVDIMERAQQQKSKLAEIKLQQMQIEDQLESAGVCFQRVRNFRPEVAGNLQCPGCWIRNEAEVAMTPIPSDTKDDRFQCPVCGQHIQIDMS